MQKIALVAAVAASSIVASVNAAVVPTITAMSGFGTNGWLAPVPVATNAQSYLGTANNERGFAYNPATGNLILVTRTTVGGLNRVKVLSGTTGGDLGSLSVTGVTGGGAFVINQVVADAAGNIYAANGTTNVTTSAFKLYKWSSETSTSAPSVVFNATITTNAGGGSITGTPRLGDTLDLIETVSGPVIAAGLNGAIGYATFSGSGATLTPALYQPAGTSSGDFRQGLAFAGTANNVWGKQTGGAVLARTTIAGTSATSDAGTTNLTNNQGPMDVAILDGKAVLATIDFVTSQVRIFDMSNPATPVQLLTGNNTTGTLVSNGNGAGAVRWGNVAADGKTATLYAMSTNQGIQAFTVFIPEPSSLGLMTLAAPALMRRRRA